MLRNLLLVSALVFAASPSNAATPANGAITDSQTSVEFSGGPYLVPNVTNIAQSADEETICEEGTETCDIFRFEVNLSDASVDDDTLVITVSWENDVIPSTPSVPETPDYDLELYNDATGEFITQQASAANPEVMITVPNNGKYQLRIIPYAGMDQPFTGKVEFVKFEEEKSKAIAFFGGAFGLGGLALLAGFGMLARKRLVG